METIISMIIEDWPLFLLSIIVGVIVTQAGIMSAAYALDEE